MAIVRNRAEHILDLTGGNWIAPAEEKNIDTSPDHEQDLLAQGVLVLVGPETAPAQPATHWPPGTRSYSGTYPGHTWDLFVPPETEDISEMDDQLLGLTGRLEQLFISPLRLDQVPQPTASVDMNGNRLVGLGAPAGDTDAATKSYVDALAQGLDIKPAVRAATTSPITLSGTQTIDGVALIAGNRVLVKNQGTQTENGIYEVAAGAWTRTTDADTGAELHTGAFVFVQEGTANASSGWVMSTTGIILLGSTALAFTQFSGAGQITAGGGITKTGNTLDVGAGTGITVGADTVAIDATVVPTLPNIPILAPDADGRNLFRPSVDAVAARFRGAASGQTHSLVEWQKASDGSLLAKVTATGRIASTDGLTTKAKAGTISDADFLATPDDATLGVNTAAAEIGWRAGATWYGARDPFTDRVFNVKSARFAGGAKADAQIISDGAITNGTAILTSAAGPFVATDVGKTIQIKGAGAAAADLLTTILSWQSATQVTVAANASTTVTGAYVAWGTDDAPACRAALAAAGTRGAVVFPPGSYLLASGGPMAVAPNGRGLTVQGYGKKITTLITTSACKVAFDTGWVGGADGDVFQDIWLTDLAVDGRVTTYPLHSSLLIGNLAGGDSAPRKNFQRIRVLRCATLLPPVTSANYLVSVESVAFTCRQTVGGEAGPTATFARDIRVEDCDFQGHFGVAVISKATSGIGTAQLDQIYVRNNTWDSGTPPTTLAGSVGLAQLGGSQGGHGHVEVTGNTCKNSWDIGIELDSWTTAIVERNTFIDSLNHHVLLVNFRAPANPNDQLLVIRDNEWRNVTLTPSAAAPGRHVYIGFNPTAYGTGDITSGSKTVLNASQTWARGEVITGAGIPAGTFVAAVSGSTLTLSQAATATTVGVALAHSGSVMGHILIEGNHSSFETAMTDVGTVLGLAVNASATAYYQSLTLRNHRIDCPNLATNPASGTHYVFCLIGSQLYGSRTVVDNVDLVLAGTIVNISSSYEVVRLAAAANEHVSVNRVAMDIQGVTTQTLGNVILAAVSVGYVSTAVVHGVIENIAITQQSSGQSAYMDLVLFGSNLTVPTGAFIRVRGGDSSRMISSGGHDYDFVAAQHGKVIIESIAAVGSTRTAGDPLRVPTSVTPPATGIAQQNTDYMPITIHVTGGTGTKLEVSKDNVTFYTVFSQASAAFAGTSFGLPAGWYWRPTYTSTPTVSKWPQVT